MFDRITTVKLYEQALKMLEDPAYDKAMVWLHDYNKECYKTDKKYTLNGLHWGYPNSIVSCLVGVDPEDNLPKDSGSTLYAVFATGPNKETAYALKLIKENTRYVKVPYAEVRHIIEKGIKQKLASARRGAKDDIAAAQLWAKHVNKTYAKYKPAAMRITSKDDIITIVALKPERFTLHGMGTFLKNIKKGEISISPQAVELLQTVRERNDLCGFNIHPTLMSYFGRGPQVSVPAENGWMLTGAWGKFSKFLKIEA